MAVLEGEAPAEPGSGGRAPAEPGSGRARSAEPGWRSRRGSAGASPPSFPPDAEITEKMVVRRAVGTVHYYLSSRHALGGQAASRLREPCQNPISRIPFLRERFSSPPDRDKTQPLTASRRRPTGSCRRFLQGRVLPVGVRRRAVSRRGAHVSQRCAPGCPLSLVTVRRHTREVAATPFSRGVDHVIARHHHRGKCAISITVPGQDHNRDWTRPLCRS